MAELLEILCSAHLMKTTMQDFATLNASMELMVSDPFAGATVLQTLPSVVVLFVLRTVHRAPLKSLMKFQIQWVSLSLSQLEQLLEP